MGDVQVNVTDTAPSAATVYLSGDIDHHTTEQLRKALVDVIVRVKPQHLVIDLDGVTAIDDQAIGVLRAAESIIRDAGLTASFHTTGSRIADDLADDGIHQAA
jgi:anti-anti-sigma factor